MGAPISVRFPLNLLPQRAFDEVLGKGVTLGDAEVMLAGKENWIDVMVDDPTLEEKEMVLADPMNVYKIDRHRFIFVATVQCSHTRKLLDGETPELTFSVGGFAKDFPGRTEGEEFVYTQPNLNELIDQANKRARIEGAKSLVRYAETLNIVAVQQGRPKPFDDSNGLTLESLAAQCEEFSRVGEGFEAKLLDPKP